MGFNLNIERREQKVLLDLFENLVRGRECYDGFNPEKKQQAYALMKKVVDGNPNETADFQESLKEVVEKQTTDDKKFKNFLKKQIKDYLHNVTPADMLEIYNGVNGYILEMTPKHRKALEFIPEALLQAYFIMTNDMIGIYKDKLYKKTNVWDEVIGRIIGDARVIRSYDELDRVDFLNKVFLNIGHRWRWLGGEYMSEIGELVGKTMIDVYAIDYEAIFFVDDSGCMYKMYHQQDCCESVFIEDINGDLNDLVGSPILKAEKIDNEEFYEEWKKEHAQNYESYTWTFYKLATQKGYVTIRWFGESNGYYSEGVDIMKLL